MLAGQAQKEFFVNQALAVLDALAPGAIAASLPVPPADPAEGACYRVADTGAGEWFLKDDHIAVRIGGSWHFIAPSEGMMLFDRQAAGWLCYRSGWQSAPPPPPIAGGTVIDVEARAAIAQLVDGLQAMGLIAPTAA